MMMMIASFHKESADDVDDALVSDAVVDAAADDVDFVVVVVADVQVE